MKLRIDKLGINGEGVCRINEKVCFVENALPDEIVNIDIKEEKKSFCIAKVSKILESSKHRVSPPCKYFDVCGGCDIQHMERSLQLEFKKQKIDETIKKIAKIDVYVDDVVRKNDFGYRNKMVFPIGQVNDRLVVGMFEKGTNKVVEISECMIAKDYINRVLAISKEYFKNSKFTGYDFKNKCGDIKYLVVRINEDSDVLVTIVANKKVNLEEYYAILKKSLKMVGLSLLVSDSEDEILSGDYYHLGGLKKLDFSEFGIKYSVDNRGFLQVNAHVKESLYNAVLHEISEDDNVIDAYSGAGLLSSIMSKKCNKVVGIEINESASNSAKNLAKRNNLENIEFVTGDVKKYIQKYLNIYKNCVVVLDPPRSGCDTHILENINQHNNCKKIIYISCNPATLARDLMILKEKYHISKVLPLDMFPQCKHVETLVVLERKE